MSCKAYNVLLMGRMLKTAFCSIMLNILGSAEGEAGAKAAKKLMEAAEATPGPPSARRHTSLIAGPVIHKALCSSSKHALPCRGDRALVWEGRLFYES